MVGITQGLVYVDLTALLTDHLNCEICGSLELVVVCPSWRCSRFFRHTRFSQLMPSSPLLGRGGDANYWTRHRLMQRKSARFVPPMIALPTS